MKNLLLLVVLSAMISSCEKESIKPVDLPIIDTVIKDTVIPPSTNLGKALAGELCSHDGYQVFVKQDTLFCRYQRYSTHTDTIWFTEFYYYIQGGGTVWCNEDYLLDCE